MTKLTIAQIASLASIAFTGTVDADPRTVRTLIKGGLIEKVQTAGENNGVEHFEVLPAGYMAAGLPADTDQVVAALSGLFGAMGEWAARPAGATTRKAEAATQADAKGPSAARVDTAAKRAAFVAGWTAWCTKYDRDGAGAAAYASATERRYYLKGWTFASVTPKATADEAGKAFADVRAKRAGRYVAA
jgi:hypothetical protein